MSVAEIEKIRAATGSAKALFFELLEQNATAALQFIAELAMEVRSTGGQTVHAWLGDVPGMVEWIGERSHGRLKAADYTLKNKHFVGGVTVNLDDLADDAIGIIRPKIMMLADKPGQHMKNLLVDLIINGATNLCYDGKAFFATDHEEGKSGAQSNSHNLALSATNYATVRKTMMELVNDQGESLDIEPDTLWCCTALEGTAKEIVEAERDSNGKTNIWRNTAKVKVFKKTGSSTMWGLADLSKPYKPLIKQMRKDMTFTAKDDPETSDLVYQTNAAHYGVDYRGNAGYGYWQLMARGKA